MTAPKRAPRPPEQRKAERRRYYLAHRLEILARRKASPRYPAELAAWRAKRAEGRREWKAARIVLWKEECSRLRAELGRPLTDDDWPRVEAVVNAKMNWTPPSERAPVVPLNGAPHGTSQRGTGTT